MRNGKTMEKKYSGYGYHSGGQNLLSPERRFDAIIFNSPEVFD